MLHLTAILVVATSLVAESGRQRPADGAGAAVSGIAEADVEKRPYVSSGRVLDVLMSHGTDRYGKVHKSLLVTILDVVRTCPQRAGEFGLSAVSSAVLLASRFRPAD